MKRTLLMLFVLAMLAQTGYSQKTKENGTVIKLINKGVLMDGKNVKGYYSFYQIDKADKNNNNYECDIYDDNFNEVNSFEIKKPNYFTLREAAFNGDAFLFLFLDSKKKAEDMISFDAKGKMLKDLYLPAMDMMMYSMMESAMKESTSSKMNENDEINSVPGKGFLRMGTEIDNKSKRTGFSLTFYTNDLVKKWAILPEATDKHKYEGYQPMYYDSKYVMGLIMAKDKIAGTDFEYDLTVYDIEAGKKAFAATLKDDRYSVVPTGGFYDADNHQFVVCGEYTDKQEKLGNGRSNGIALLAFDETGKPKATKYMSWTKDLNKLISVDSKGKIADGGYVGVQKMFRTADGKIFAIAEQYKKEASAAGVAMAVLSMGQSAGRQSVVGIKLMDLMILEFAPDFSIAKVSSFDKGERHIDLPATLGYYPLNIISLFMRTWGYFDYNFLTTSEDGKGFSVCYDITNKKSSDPPKVGNLVYTPEGAFSPNSIEIKDKPTLYNVLPAKWGYLGVMEYYSKEKKVTRRVEKLDY
ncbi:MAG TPA: DUF6770 family protein [Chitinophagales bacterium]|nr:DUF6770 family protein [Chitinophagales bacterium]